MAERRCIGGLRDQALLVLGDHEVPLPQHHQQYVGQRFGGAFRSPFCEEPALRFAKELQALRQRLELLSCSHGNARKPLHQDWIIPRCFQVLAAKFACELSSIAPNKGGLITCDWSTYHMDRHVSDCVHTFVLAHQITTIVGGVTYGSSRSLVTIQVVDRVAGAFASTMREARTFSN